MVISWNTILEVFLISNHNSLATCRHIASHSRSSSVAIQTLSACLAYFFSSAIVFFLSGLTSYIGLKLFSTSTHNFFCGKSTTCQYDAFTSKSFQSIFFIVSDLAGDSTITRFFAMSFEWMINVFISQILCML